jgi:hypothetical protein
MTEPKKPTGREGIRFPYPENDFFDDDLPNGVISPSGFGTYIKCPRQYEYAYVKGIRKAPGIAMLKGTSIHKGAEVVHRHTIEHGVPLGVDEATQAVADTFAAEEESVEDVTKEEKGVAKDEAIKSFRVYHRDAVPHIKPVAAEKPFAVKIGTVPVRGVIDLIDKVPGEYSLEDDPELPPPEIEVVSDLKTTAKRWSPQQLAFDQQLTIYAIVENTSRVRIDMLLAQKKATTYCPMRAHRSRAMKQSLVEDLEEVVTYIKKGVFPRCNPTSWVCTERYCGYYKDCRGKLY